jgi:hypothetical protein
MLAEGGGLAIKDGALRLVVFGAALVPSCLELIRSMIARAWMPLVSGSASAATAIVAVSSHLMTGAMSSGG